MIVQRTLAAKNVSEARRGTILAGFLKILPVFILVLPGVAGRILFPDTKPNDIYAKMVNDLLPVGVKGMVVAALLAALMSSLSAVFNSSSTLVVIDFYQRLRPKATERELVWAGQISTAVLVVVGLVWIPFIGVVSDQLFVYLQSVQAYISPPIAAVFLVGLIWRRANATGAFAALVIGFVLGAVRFVAELGVKSATPWVTWPPLVQFAEINFLHVAIILFVISVVVLVGVSLMTAVPTATNQRVFDKTVAAAHDLRGAERSKVNVILSVVLVVAVLAMWLYFSKVFFK